MSSRAGNIEAALDVAIFDDDPDALDRLRAKLADLEAQRAQMVEANKAYRKTHRAELAAESSAYQRSLMVPYAGYQLSNLGGTITKTRERIKRLEGTPRAFAPVAPDAGPIERAGLIIHATMTTPSRPGKKPRPVWNVGGNLGPHRALLDGLGGSWYRGVFSFWEVPTDAITAALDQVEAPLRQVVEAQTAAITDARASALADIPFSLTPTTDDPGGHQLSLLTPPKGQI